MAQNSEISRRNLLEANELRKSFRRGGGVFSSQADDARFTAVDGVSLQVAEGETFAVVGESGCGKTTLARILLRPKLVVADEPVSALDVSVGAQVLLLLQDLQREFGLTYIFISHSLPVVAQLATRIAVMRSGKFVEVGTADQILRRPAHPYTRELLAAVPELLRV
jgi:ABC-type oligopeptide transport system ATPase subunit